MEKTPRIVKERADRHTYGPDMSLHGSVYCAYSGEQLVCYAATAGEARRLYNKARWQSFDKKVPEKNV
jgi:hypothetical protein